MAANQYMPTCPCGTTLTDLRDVDEQIRWSEKLNESWGVTKKGTAYWFRCLRCHRKEWPNDFRVNNRHSRPAPAWLDLRIVDPRGNRGGDYFYLTTPPPERVAREVRSAWELAGEDNGSSREEKRRKCSDAGASPSAASSGVVA